MPGIRVQHHVDRATDFLDGMQLLRTDSSFRNSSALLAIHSSISFSDALRSGLGDEGLSADDHRKAADALRSALPSSMSEAQAGIQHLRYLLSRKNVVSYGDQRLERTDFKALYTRAERFAKSAKDVARGNRSSKGGPMETDELQQLGRAKNAVLSYFEQTLSIPKIYIDAEWDGHHVDVLAINRDGAGDVSVVLLTPYIVPLDMELLAKNKESSFRLLDRLEIISAQFKYIAYANIEYVTIEYVHIAYVNARADGFPTGVSPDVLDRSLAPDGIGKVGFMAVETTRDGQPEAKILVKPERFRAKVAKLADAYVQQHEADWEIRA